MKMKYRRSIEKANMLSKLRLSPKPGITITGTCILVIGQPLSRCHDSYTGLDTEHGKSFCHVGCAGTFLRQEWGAMKGNTPKGKRMADEAIVVQKRL